MSLNGQHPYRPNSLHYTHDSTFGASFGTVHSVTPVSLSGLGHTPRVEVRFKHGLRIDFTPEVVVELARRFPEALAQLNFVPDIHDATVGDQ